MSTSPAAFTTWLNAKLRELKTDESVFGAYIVGILEGDEAPEEKSEALTDILSEIINDDIDQVIATILNKWQECQPNEQELPKKGVTIDVNEQLAKLLEAQKLQTVKERVMTEEERRVKEQILAQYSQTAVSDEEADDSDDDGETAGGTGGGGGGGGALERNTNAHDVMQLQKERREQARADSAAKKQKDKDDREKQKQMREEKKEKRKTVKGERRR